MRRLVEPLVKICIIAISLWGLYRLSHRVIDVVQNTNENDHDADDLPMPVVDVHVGVIRESTLRAYVTAYGTVDCEPASAGRPASGARVGPPLAGVVAAVDCVEGQHVEKGQELFHLDSRAADAAVERAHSVLEAARKRSAELAQSSQASAAPLWQQSMADKDRALAEADLARAEAQRKLLDVASPVSGTVVDVRIRPGEGADANTEVVTVADLDRLVVTANIPVAQLAKIRLGQRATIELPGMAYARPATRADDDAAPATDPAALDTPPPDPTKGRSLTGEVTLIDDLIDPTSGMGTVDVRLPAGSGPSTALRTGLRPGQFVRVEILTEERRGCLTVPVQSVARNADGLPVINLVRREDFKSTIQRTVQTGLRDGDLIEVHGEGLRAGQLVVTTGAYGLPARTEIHVIDP